MQTSPTFIPRLGVRYAFRRPISRVIVDVIGLPIGATVFLGASWLHLTGAIVPEGRVAQQ